MTVSLSTSITPVVAKKPLRLTFTASTGNFSRIWCTSAPIDSKLRDALDKSTAQRVKFTEADSGRPIEYTFDVAGAYLFAAQEIKRGATDYGGGYQDAPDAAPAEALIGETSIALYVASGLKATLGAGADVADLVLYVSDTTIQTTTLAVHGVATPGAQNPKTDKAKTAATSTAVSNAVTALAGQVATTSLGTLSAVATDFIDKFNLHIGDITYHNQTDGGANRIPVDFRNPTTADALKRTLAQILRSLNAHIRNDSPVQPSGTGTAPWHRISGANVVDWASLPLFDSTAKIGEHVRGLADAWRSFESHRVSTAHPTPDTVHALTALPPLLNVHQLFLAQLAALSPNAPVTDSSAKTLLVHGAGFEEI